jgi:hypothetical protein
MDLGHFLFLDEIRVVENDPGYLSRWKAKVD